MLEPKTELTQAINLTRLSPDLLLTEPTNHCVVAGRNNGAPAASSVVGYHNRRSSS
ncbi:hypothetical protein Hanom_Chr17g01569311 [Helianthus anomalus]